MRVQTKTQIGSFQKHYHQQKKSRMKGDSPNLHNFISSVSMLKLFFIVKVMTPIMMERSSCIVSYSTVVLLTPIPNLFTPTTQRRKLASTLCNAKKTGSLLFSFPNEKNTMTSPSPPPPASSSSSSPPTAAAASPTSSSDWDERTNAETALKVAHEKLQSLCATHAATFVAVERRGSKVTHALESLLHSLDQAHPAVMASQDCLVSEDAKEKEQDEEELHSSSSSSSKNALATLMEQHKIRRRTLLHHSSLLDILELPPLLHACIRGQWYTEALDVCSMANTLQRRHGTSNAVLNQVIADLKNGQGELRAGLIHRWKGPVSLPECLEVVTALRRLNAMDLENVVLVGQDVEALHEGREYGLQLSFLEARDVWLESIKLEPRNKGAEPLLDLIDGYRTR